SERRQELIKGDSEIEKSLSEIYDSYPEQQIELNIPVKLSLSARKYISDIMSFGGYWEDYVDELVVVDAALGQDHNLSKVQAALINSQLPSFFESLCQESLRLFDDHRKINTYLRKARKVLHKLLLNHHYKTIAKVAKKLEERF